MQTVKTRKFKKILKEYGYRLRRIKGSHYHYQKGDGHTLTFPGGANEINRCLARRLLREIGYEVDNSRG